MQICPPHFAAAEHMVLASVDDVQANACALHHRRTSTAQVMRRPFTIYTFGEHQRVVVGAVLERLTILESSLLVADLLGYAFQTYVRVFGIIGFFGVSSWETPAADPVALERLERPKLSKGKGAQVDDVVLLFGVGLLSVFLRDAPDASLRVHVCPLGHQQLANAAKSGQAN